MRGDLRAVQARPEQPDRHVATDARNCAHWVTLLGRRLKIFSEFDHVTNEIILALRGERAPQRAHGHLVGARRAAEAQVDAAGVNGGERAELFSDDQWRMVWQHDAAGADAQRLGTRCDIPNQHRGCRAGHAVHVVMLGDPEAVVAERLGVLREVKRVAQRLGCVAAFNDRRKVED